MPTAAEMRVASYIIMKSVCEQADPEVKRALAGAAFVLAQRAQLKSWDENGGGGKRAAFDSGRAIRP